MYKKELIDMYIYNNTILILQHVKYCSPIFFGVFTRNSSKWKSSIFFLTKLLKALRAIATCFHSYLSNQLRYSQLPSHSMGSSHYPKIRPIGCMRIRALNLPGLLRLSFDVPYFLFATYDITKFCELRFLLNKNKGE